MAGLPLTAWALRHPWGAHVDAVLDHLRDAPRIRETETETGSSTEVLAELLDELAGPCSRACSRWGPSRVALVLTGTISMMGSTETAPSVLTLARECTGITGPTYHLVAAGGAEAVVSAERLLRASLADAVLAGAIDDDRGALLLLERHGDAFVELQTSAAATGTPDGSAPDEAAIREAVSTAWSAAGRPALGGAHAHAVAGPDAEVEQRALQAVLGSIPCVSTRAPGSAVASDDVIDVVLATASLIRGFSPGAPARELEHDRLLVHASSPIGHHVALLLEARS